MNRTKNTIINTGVGISSFVLLFITNFFVRTYFVSLLNIEFLGFKTLLNSILTFLSLSEVGFSSALMFSFYRFIKDQNLSAIKSILDFSSKVFRFIGLFILFVGFFLAFFIVDIVNSEIISSNLIVLVFIIQIFALSQNYFFLYKKIFINANQLNYVISIIETLFTVIISIINVYLLSIFKDFLLFSIIGAANLLLSNIFISLYYNFKFKELRKFKGKLNKNYYNSFLKNIPYSLIIKFGGFIYFFMDTIIINYYLGLAVIGILANYQLIISSVKTFFGSFNTSLVPSLGNFLAGSQTNQNVTALFKRLSFLFVVLGGIISVGFALLINPFINLWLGSDYLISNVNVLLISIVFLFDQITTALWHFLNSSGKFKNESVSSIIASLVKFILSVILVNIIGITGIFIGTIISNFVYFLNRTKYLNKTFFKNSNYIYLRDLFIQLGFIVMQYLFLSLIISYFDINSWFQLIVAFLITSSILILTNILFYIRNSEFRFFVSTFYRIFSKRNKI